MLPKISVIIPVYKVELFLTKCIESILCQTYSNFELILVNDGSPDNSGKICEEFAERDSRIIVIHKCNGGVSSARNIGIEVSKGDWLCFVDGDDYVIPTYLEDFIEKSEASELVMQGYQKIYRDEVVFAVSFDKLQSSKFEAILEYSEKKHIINSPCFKLFLRSIVIDNNIRFDTNISYGEDHLFSLTYIACIDKVTYSTSSGYNYVISDSESLTRRRVPYQQMIYYTEELDKIINQLLSKHDSEKLKNAFMLTREDNIFRTLRYFFLSDYKFSDYSTMLNGLSLMKIKNFSKSSKRNLIVNLIKYTSHRFSFFVFNILKFINLI